MYLQLLELCPFTHYFSYWLMLILQLNVLLVYIFKVASGCDFVGFFLKGFVVQHYQGSGTDSKVCSCLSLTHLLDEWWCFEVLTAASHWPGHGEWSLFTHIMLVSGLVCGQAHELGVIQTLLQTWTAAVVPRWRLYLSVLLEQVSSLWAYQEKS